MLVAIVAGYLIFSEVPKTMTLFGAGLIVVSSFIIFRREATLKKQVVAPRVWNQGGGKNLKDISQYDKEILNEVK